MIGANVSIITTVVSAVLFPSNNDPTYAQNALFIYFIVGTLLELVGSIGLATPMLRRHVLPRWPGYALVVSALLLPVSFFLSGPDTSQSALTVALNQIAVLLLLVAFVGLGLNC